MLAAVPASSSNTAAHIAFSQQQQLLLGNQTTQAMLQHQQVLLQQLRLEQEQLQVLQAQQQLTSQMSCLQGLGASSAAAAAGSGTKRCTLTHHNVGSDAAAAPGMPPVDGQMGSLVEHLGAVQKLLSQARSLLTSVHQVDPAAAADMVRHIKANLKGTTGIDSALAAAGFGPVPALQPAAASGAAGLGLGVQLMQQQGQQQQQQGQQQQQQMFGVTAAPQLQQQQQDAQMQFAYM
jgi:hypothetical protein